MRELLIVAIHRSGGRNSTADQIAAVFAMLRRTLHRRLNAFGTGVQEVADEVRFEIARQLLEDSAMDTVQLAAMLDYAQASAFTRAFGVGAVRHRHSG
jgi:AraC-like DNA-binding protein